MILEEQLKKWEKFVEILKYFNFDNEIDYIFATFSRKEQENYHSYLLGCKKHNRPVISASEWLKDKELMSWEAIARVLKIHPTTAKKNYLKAIEKIKKHKNYNILKEFYDLSDI